MSDFEVVEVGAQRELAELRKQRDALKAALMDMMDLREAHLRNECLPDRPELSVIANARAALGASRVAERRIRTHYDPKLMTNNRSCDWCAHYDDDDGEGNVGWGATKAEAIADLKAQDDE